MRNLTFFRSKKVKLKENQKVFTFVLNDNCNNNLNLQQFIRLTKIILKIIQKIIQKNLRENVYGSCFCGV